MKGIALIGMLLALLVAAYLMLKSTKQATAPEVLGKNVPMVNTPTVAEQKVNDAMKVEEQRLKEQQKEMEQSQ